MYTTLAKVKTYLWITSSTSDDRLTAILDGVEAFVFNIIWDINTNDKTETINKIFIGDDGNTIPLKNWKVTKIKTVNWTDFTSKVNWTDYLIRANDTVTITSLCSFLSDLNFDVFDIVYTSGIATIPVDLENAIAELVWFEFAKELGKNVTSETTGPRKVAYWGGWINWIENSEVKRNEALTVINNYKVLNLKHFT